MEPWVWLEYTHLRAGFEFAEEPGRRRRLTSGERYSATTVARWMSASNNCEKLLVAVRQGEIEIRAPARRSLRMRMSVRLPHENSTGRRRFYGFSFTIYGAPEWCGQVVPLP